MMSQLAFPSVTALGALGLFLMAWGWSSRRRRLSGKVPRPVAAASVPTEPAAEPAAGRLEQRIERIEARLAELGNRVSAGSSDDKLQAMAGSLLALVRDKNAAMETTLAGLDQLRARMRTLEQLGSAAEARGLFESLVARLDASRAAETALTARIAALEATEPGAAMAAQFTRLMEHRDAGLAAVLERLGPIEAQLGGFAPRLAALEAPAENPFAEVSEQLTRLYAQKLEIPGGPPFTEITAQLAQLQARIDELEAPGEDPLAGLETELARLRAERDTTMETVFGRLAPLENRLAQVAAGLATTAPRLAALEAADPRAELAGIMERIAALQAAQGNAGERLAALQAIVSDGQPFAEISQQLAELHAQKDAAIDAVASRLAPFEARLTEIEARPVPAGPDEALAHAEEIATQMIALRAAAAQTELFADRLALLETTLPRLSAAQALMLKALDRQGLKVSVPAAAPDFAALPQVINLHHG